MLSAQSKTSVGETNINNRKAKAVFSHRIPEKTAISTIVYFFHIRVCRGHMYFSFQK